jgi:ribosomal protein S18
MWKKKGKKKMKIKGNNGKIKDVKWVKNNEKLEKFVSE